MTPRTGMHRYPDTILVSRLYDGTVVTTPPGHPGQNSQTKQAREHRQRVRWLLTKGRQARWLKNDPPSSGVTKAGLFPWR